MNQLELFEPEVVEPEVQLSPFDLDIHLRINSKSNNERYLKSNYYIWNKPNGCTLDNDDMKEWFKYATAPNCYPHYLFWCFASNLDYKRIHGKRKSEK